MGFKCFVNVSFFRLVVVSQVCLTLLFVPFDMSEIFNNKLIFKVNLPSTSFLSHPLSSLLANSFSLLLFVFFREPLLAFIFITFIIFLFFDSLVSAFVFANSFCSLGLYAVL